MIWTPHATVATIVRSKDQFLLVEETSHDRTVFNQPAGHIEEGESILEAAVRETLEETGWQVQPTGLIGIYTYLAPENGVTYYRFCLSADPIEHISDELDDGIIAAHWKTVPDIRALSHQLRSPLVLKCIEDANARPALPLNIIYEHNHA